MTPTSNLNSPAANEGKKEITSRPMTPLEKRMAEDLHWAATAPAVQQHAGKLVIIRDKRVIAVGDDRGKLLQLAADQEGCPTWEFVVEVVPSIDVWEIDH